MKAAVIATIILVVLFGGAAYLAAAGTLIIYALGNNKATKGKELFSLNGGHGSSSWGSAPDWGDSDSD